MTKRNITVDSRDVDWVVADLVERGFTVRAQHLGGSSYMVHYWRKAGRANHHTCTSAPHRAELDDDGFLFESCRMFCAAADKWLAKRCSGSRRRRSRVGNMTKAGGSDDAA